MLLNELYGDELQEGPVWDKVKRTAAAGAVATGLGYAALTGQGADKAEQPPQQATQQSVNVADKADKIGKHKIAHASHKRHFAFFTGHA